MIFYVIIVLLRLWLELVILRDFYDNCTYSTSTSYTLVVSTRSLRGTTLLLLPAATTSLYLWATNYIYLLHILYTSNGTDILHLLFSFRLVVFNFIPFIRHWQQLLHHSLLYTLYTEYKYTRLLCLFSSYLLFIIFTVIAVIPNSTDLIIIISSIMRTRV